MTREDIADTTFLVEVARQSRLLEKDVKRVVAYVMKVIIIIKIITIIIIFIMLLSM